MPYNIKQYAILSLMLFLLAHAPLRAQRVVVEHQTIDVGQVVYRQPVTARFSLRNNEGRPLTIDSVDTSCGCVTVEQLPSSIAGNTDFNLSVVYDAKLMGHFDRYVDLYAGGNPDPLHLMVRGVVVCQVSEYDGSFDYTLGNLQADRRSVAFDDVRQGETPFIDINVKNTTRRQLTPVVMHQPDYISSEVSPTTIPPGKQGVVRIMLQSSKLNDMGLTQTTVYLGSNPGERVRDAGAVDVSVVLLPGYQNAALSPTAAVPRLEYQDAKFAFGPLEGKSKKTAYITLTNTGNAPLEILALQMLTDGLKVSLPKRIIGKGEHVRMKIVGEKRRLHQQKTNPRIMIITNDPVHPKVVFEGELG